MSFDTIHCVKTRLSPNIELSVESSQRDRDAVSSTPTKDIFSID